MPRSKGRTLEASPPLASGNGHQDGVTPYDFKPDGNEGVWGTDIGDAAWRMPDAAAKYIEVHPEKPNRLWAETYFADDRDLALSLRLLADTMDDHGQLDIPTLMAAKMAGRIAIKFKGKEMAKEVDIAGSRSAGRFNAMRFMGRGRSEGPRGW